MGAAHDSLRALPSQKGHIQNPVRLHPFRRWRRPAARRWFRLAHTPAAGMINHQDVFSDALTPPLHSLFRLLAVGSGRRPAVLSP